MGGLTFGELAAAYVESAPARQEPSTINALVYRLNARILPLLSAEPAAAITAARLDGYMAARMRQQFRGRPPAQATIRRELNDIVAILHWSVRHERLAAYPAEGFRKPRGQSPAVRPPTQEEVKQLIAAASEHIRRLILLLWYCGLRPGREVLTLRWDAVNWDSRTLYVTSARKHGLSSRHVPIHPDLFALLLQWRAGSDSDFIVSYRGRRLTRIQDGFQRAVYRAGLRGITPYSLRHAFATNSLLATGNLRAVSSILGHSSPRITAEVYTATSGEIERAVVERVPSVIL